MEQGKVIDFFVGSYTDKIQKVQFNSSTSTLTVTDSLQVKNGSFLYLIKEDNILISVSETQDNPLVVLIDLDESSPTYKQVVQELPTHGADPCHISYSRKNHVVFISNYSGSSMSYYTYKEKRLALIETIKYESDVSGEKGNAVRQEAPHPHSVILDTTEQYAFLQDLGCDLIRIYELNAEGKPIQLKKSIQVPYGSGPRLVYNKNDRIYLITELTHVVYIYDFNREEVDLKLVQSIPLFKEGSKEEIAKSYSAEITVDEDNTIYVSCREVDRIFIIKQGNNENNTLVIENAETFTQPSISTLGRWPRNFRITKDYIVAANQKSNSLIIFDKVTLKQLSQIEIEIPVFIEFQ